jgi:hypothetical protein
VRSKLPAAKYVACTGEIPSISSPFILPNGQGDFDSDSLPDGSRYVNLPGVNSYPTSGSENRGTDNTTLPFLDFFHSTSGVPLIWTDGSVVEDTIAVTEGGGVSYLGELLVVNYYFFL